MMLWRADFVTMVSTFLEMRKSRSGMSRVKMDTSRTGMMDLGEESEMSSVRGAQEGQAAHEAAFAVLG